MAGHDTADTRAKVLALARTIKVAMLATRGPDGRFHSRPMAVSGVESEGTLHFLSAAGSGKVNEIAEDPEALVTFADPKSNRFVSMRGRATLSSEPDAIRAHWTPAARAWFPGGPDDRQVLLVSVEIEDAEYWDVGSGRIEVLYAYAKAIITGEPPGELGDHRRVAMN